MLFIARTAVLCALLTAAAADVALLQAEYAELAGDSAIKTLTAFMRVPFGPIRRSLLSFELGHVDILAPNALAFGPSMNAVNDLFYSQMIDTDRELDMIYAGMEGGEFFGYFSSLDMTYRAAGASTASQMSFDPYTLSNVNEAVDAGQARGVDGQFVAADCSAVAADNQFLVSGRACVDSDVRNYYTADRLGRSSAFTRWRTYDPRLRSWYISGKAAHAANSSVRLMWSDVYTFVDGAQGISSLGVITDPTDSSFKGLLAVDYKLATITKFLIEEYGHSNDLAVYVLERSSKFLLGTSTGSALVAEDNSQLTAMDSADSLIAASATALDKTGWSTNSLIYGRHKVQTRKLQDNAGLDWIVVLVQPIECDSNAFYNYTKQACVECPFMMSVNVDPATSALMPCVCDAGGFSVAEAKFTFCFGNDHLPRKEALGNPEYKHYTDDIEKGLQCSVCPPCVDCGGAPADLPAGVPLVREGYGVSPVSLDEYGGHAMHAHRPVDRMSRLRTQTNNVTDIVALQCPFDDSCLGERVDNVTGELAMFCADGYTGPLCAVCIDGYGHGSSGCEECKEFDPKVYFMLPAILLFLIVMVVIHRKHVVNLLPQGDNQDLMGVLVDVVEDDTPDADDDDVAAKPKDTSRGDAGDAGDGGEGDEENSTKRDTSKSAANDATMAKDMQGDGREVVANSTGTEGLTPDSLKLFFSTISKAFISLAQIVGSIEVSLRINLPEWDINGPFAFLIHLFENFTFDPFVIMNLNCLLGNTFYIKFWTSLLMPVLLIGIVFLVSLIKMKVDGPPELVNPTAKQKRYLRHEFDLIAWNDDGGELDTANVTAGDIAAACHDLGIKFSAEEIAQIFAEVDEDNDGTISFDEFVHALHKGKGKFVELLIAFDKRQRLHRVYAVVEIVLFILYPGICGTCFSALNCRELSSEVSVLSVDYSIDCNAEGYRQFYYAVVLVILAVPIGIPVVTLLILRAHKDDLLKGDPKATALLESLVGDYEPEHYYWEVVEMSRKLALTGFITFIAPGTSVQTAVAVFTAAMFLMAHCAARPMLNSALDVVKGIAEFLTFIVMLAMLLSKTGFDDAELNVLSWALLVTMACCVAAMVLVIIFRLKFQDADEPVKDTAVDDTVTLVMNPLTDGQEDTEEVVAKKKKGFGKFAGAGKTEPPEECPLQKREQALREESDALFRLIDSNGDGALSRKEINKGLDTLAQSTGLKLAGKKAKEVFGHLDDGNDGQVDAEEFFAFVSTAQERAASDRLFHKLDKSGDGLLSRKEIRMGLAALSETSGIFMKAQEVLAAADVSGGGKLDRGEFFKFLLANKTHEAGAGSFRTGDVAVWLKSDADIPDGSQGVVLGFKANGRVRLRFDALGGKEFSFNPGELAKLHVG